MATHKFKAALERWCGPCQSNVTFFDAPSPQHPNGRERCAQCRNPPNAVRVGDGWPGTLCGNIYQTSSFAVRALKVLIARGVPRTNNQGT